MSKVFSLLWFMTGVTFAGFLVGSPVPCEVAARQDVGPAPKADVTPAKLAIGGLLQVEPYRLVKLSAQGVTGGEFLWDVVPLDDAAATIDWATPNDGEQIAFVAPPGRYQVELLVIRDTKPRLARQKATVTIGTAPIPPPKPVDPKVDPTPAPKPATAFRVILAREAGAAIPPWINSPRIVEYLNRKCVKGPTGQPEWRVYDPQQQLTAKESPTMKAFWDATKPNLGTLPQLAISPSPADSQLHPLPATEDEMLALLKKYGGE